MTHNLSLETTSSHTHLIDSSNKNCIFSTKTELIKADTRHQISHQSTRHQKMEVIKASTFIISRNDELILELAQWCGVQRLTRLCFHGEKQLEPCRIWMCVGVVTLDEYHSASSRTRDI